MLRAPLIWLGIKTVRAVTRVVGGGIRVRKEVSTESALHPEGSHRRFEAPRILRSLSHQ
jgi:hypothetical protein